VKEAQARCEIGEGVEGEGFFFKFFLKRVPKLGFFTEPKVIKKTEGLRARTFIEYRIYSIKTFKKP
jgi:hypothetical protein